MDRTVEARDKAHNIIAYQANIHSLTHDTSLSSSEKNPSSLRPSRAYLGCHISVQESDRICKHGTRS